MELLFKKTLNKNSNQQIFVKEVHLWSEGSICTTQNWQEFWKECEKSKTLGLWWKT